MGVPLNIKIEIQKSEETIWALHNVSLMQAPGSSFWQKWRRHHEDGKPPKSP